MYFIFSLEFVSVSDPLCMRTCSTSSLRFCSPSRHQLKESTCDELPSSHLVPFSVFRPLSTVYSSPSLLSLFHPKAASKIRFPGVFPAIKPPRLIVASFPLCISEVRLLRISSRRTSFTTPTFPAAHSGFTPDGDPSQPPVGLAPIPSDPLLSF